MLFTLYQSHLAKFNGTGASSIRRPSQTTMGDSIAKGLGAVPGKGWTRTGQQVLTKLRNLATELANVRPFLPSIAYPPSDHKLTGLI